jgi:hypothetical protein
MAILRDIFGLLGYGKNSLLSAAAQVALPQEAGRIARAKKGLTAACRGGLVKNVTLSTEYNLPACV